MLMGRLMKSFVQTSTHTFQQNAQRTQCSVMTPPPKEIDTDFIIGEEIHT